jgi:hypothetical protein
MLALVCHVGLRLEVLLDPGFACPASLNARSDLASRSKTSRPLKIWVELERVSFAYLSWETFV